jgi:hypothetical protein
MQPSLLSGTTRLWAPRLFPLLWPTPTAACQEERIPQPCPPTIFATAVLRNTVVEPNVPLHFTLDFLYATTATTSRWHEQQSDLLLGGIYQVWLERITPLQWPRPTGGDRTLPDIIRRCSSKCSTR